MRNGLRLFESFYCWQNDPNPTAERNPASAPLFIINPLSGAGIDNLFSTHPNIENRIARLNETRQMGQL